jgi:site-specific recombinase XerD
MADLPLLQVSRDTIRAYCLQRLKRVALSTISSEVRALRRTFVFLMGTDGPRLDNPAMGFELPESTDGAGQNLSSDEAEALRLALSSNPTVKALVDFAVATDLTQRQIIDLKWCDVDQERAVVHLPAQKDVPACEVALGSRALEVLDGLAADQDRVFPIGLYNLQVACEVACARAGLKALRFNSLRHLIRKVEATDGKSEPLPST